LIREKQNFLKIEFEFFVAFL
jgi:hypothetical protein